MSGPPHARTTADSLAAASPAPAVGHSGGSGARIRIVGDLVVKSTDATGAGKLAAEGRWLKWVGAASRPAAIRSRFPVVLGRSEATGSTLFLRRLPGRDARTLALAGPGHATRRLVGSAVRFAFQDLAELDVRQSGWDTGAWCAEHLDDSLERSEGHHPPVRLLRHAERVVVGGLPVANPLSADGGFVRERVRALRAVRTQVIHGDLHLGNMLVHEERDAFYLLDPRGDWGGERTFDPAYDVAKLLHEAHYLCARWGRPSGGAVLNLGELRFPAAAPGTPPVHPALPRLALFNARLAASACRQLDDDPGVAARATLLTGVLLLSVLRFPHTVSYRWETLLAHGLAWLSVGLRATEGRWTLRESWAEWARLNRLVFPYAREAASSYGGDGCVRDPACKALPR
ncbi:phosphotransferase [Streptomyces sp. NPDC014685]|uniref:phosphotransferase n=1 Tax=Streptomyces sp. NPDC014685 TaxID=3364881 RepID=UPI0036F754AD